MGKSKYPNKLDTSLEIPAVRDNIVEVGSDVLNSLRSAVFNIERALGINPQGSTGNTVASRINRSLDGNGNILKEALDRAGLVSGPISNNDVSKVAGIDESKLNLNYPTSLLQDEISQLIRQIDVITKTLEELAYLYASHTHPEAKNRHKGQAITIDAIEALESSEGMITSETQTAQELFEKVFSSHINYNGSDISATNRSHEADQIFFDNADVSAFVPSSDVQGAIVDVLNQTSGQLVDHQNLHHSNGKLRTSSLQGAETGLGQMILDEQLVSFFRPASEEVSRIITIAFPSNPEYPTAGMLKSDILRLYSGEDETYLDFQIESVQTDGANKLEHINVYGSILRDSHPLDSARVFRNPNAIANPSGLLVSHRPNPNATNIDLIQVANPDSAYIISSGIKPSEITVDNRYINIVIDGNKEIIVDVFDVSFEKQTIDTIIYKMNYKFAEQAANVLAYRVDYDHTNSSEIAIVHNMPSSYGSDFTVSVKRDSDDAIDSLGFSHIEDITEVGLFGSQFFVQGHPHTTFDLKLEQAGLNLLAGTSAIGSYSVGLDFESYGITDGDIIIIKNSGSDDGSYVIRDVNPTTIEVDSNQLSTGSWSGESTESTLFYILKTSLSFQSFNFLKEWDASNLAVIDIFLDKNKNLFYNTRLEGAAIVYGASNTLVSICDFEGDISLYTESDPGLITLSLDLDNVPQIVFDGGPPVSLNGVQNSYFRLESGGKGTAVIVYIEDSDTIFSKLDNDGVPFSINFNGYNQVNLEENMLLGRASFESATSRIVGAGGEVPRVFQKTESGVTSYKDLSTNAIKKVLQEPILEMRSNGVSRGLYLTPSSTPIVNDYYSVNITAGSCYVRGKRFEFDEITDLITDVHTDDADKVFIAINEWGELVFGGANSSGGTVACSSPFSSDSHCILSCLEYDTITVREVDLRLMINNLDLKLLNSITVSPQPGMGHFQDLGSAIKYAKRFTDIFPNAGTPTIHLKSGTHKIVVNAGVNYADYDFDTHLPQAAYESGVYINFPVNIVGEGDSTIVDIATEYLDLGIENDDRTDAGFSRHQGHLIIAGSGFSGVAGDVGVLDSGQVCFRDLKFRLTSVSLLDPRITNDDGHILNTHVIFKNVSFDYGEKEGISISSNSGIRFYSINSDDAIDEVGNLLVEECSFIRSHINMSRFKDSLYHNISVNRNVVRGNGEQGNFPNLYIFYGCNPTSFDSVPMGNNFEFRGNILGGYLLDPHEAGDIDYGGGVWSDRIEGNIRLGRQLSIGGDGNISALPTKAGYGIDLREPILGSGITQNGIRIAKGNLDIAEGDIESDSGNLRLYDGHITLYDGNVTLDDGELYMYDGFIRVRNTNTSASLHLDTMAPANSDYSYVELRKSASIGEFETIGQIKFTGTGSGLYAASIDAISETANFDLSDRTTRLSFKTCEGSGNIREGLRVYPNGMVRISASGSDSDVDLNGVSGSLVISEGGSNPETFRHIAIDDNEIQAKLNATSAGTLYLNSEGGDVRFGSGSDRLTINGNTISSGSNVVIDDNLYVNQFLSCADTIYSKNLSVSAGTVLGSQNAAVFVGNSGVTGNTSTNTGGNQFESSVVKIQDYQPDARDGIALIIQMMQVGASTLDDGNPSTETAELYIAFTDNDGAVVGYIANQSGSMVYGGFTGSHITPVSKEELDDFYQEGLIVSSNGIALTDQFLSEPYVGTTVSKKEKDKAVLGVTTGGPRLYDEGITLAGWKKGVYGITVNSVGNGRVWVTNIAGDIENGDFICSSNIPGYGQMQDDDLMHNYTVAKATEAVNWDNVTDTVTHNGVKYKKFLIACSYHCG